MTINYLQRFFACMLYFWWDMALLVDWTQSAIDRIIKKLSRHDNMFLMVARSTPKSSRFPAITCYNCLIIMVTQHWSSLTTTAEGCFILNNHLKFKTNKLKFSFIYSRLIQFANWVTPYLPCIPSETLSDLSLHLCQCQGDWRCIQLFLQLHSMLNNENDL